MEDLKANSKYMFYNDIIVVEGKNDKARILAIYPNANVITTNGSEISNDTLNMIKKLSLNHGIILFLDPDYPGERIRAKITNIIPNAKQAFIEKSKAIDYHKHKVGVEHASFDDIRYALDNLLEPTINAGNLKMSDLFSLELVGTDKAFNKREYLSSILHIGNPNGKTLLKRLNWLHLSYEEVRSILDENNWNC